MTAFNSKWKSVFEIRKISRCRSRSLDYAKLSHFTFSCFAEDSKEMCTAIVLIKPFVWWRSRCLRRRGLLKLPNQKRRVIRSSENQTDKVGSRTPILFMAPSLTIRWKLDCRSRKQTRTNKPIAIFDSGPRDWLVLPLRLPTPAILSSLDREATES